MDPVLQFISLYSEVNSSFKLPYHSPAGRETLRPHFITMKDYEKAIFVWVLYQSLPHLSITYVIIRVHFLSLQVLLLLGDTVLPTCFRGSAHHSAQQHLHESVRGGEVFASPCSQLLPALGSQLSPLNTHLPFQKVWVLLKLTFWKGTRHTSVPISRCTDRVLPPLLSTGHTFFSAGYPQKAVTVDSTLTKKNREKEANFAFIIPLKFKLASKVWAGVICIRVKSVKSQQGLLCCPG